MKPKFFCIIICLVFLATCAVPTPRLTPIDIAILPPTTTSVVEPTATLVPTVTLTQTSQPTATLASTKYQSPTPKPTTPAQATQGAMQEKYCPNSGYVSNFLFSKSQKWAAFTCYSEQSPDISFTRIACVDSSENGARLSFLKDYLEVFQSDLLNTDRSGFVRAMGAQAVLRPVRWTADDKFLFLSFDSPIDGIQYGGSYALMRLEVATGKLTSLLPPMGTYSFIFSADGTQIISVDQSKKPMVVKIQNLVTGGLVKISLDEKFDEAGYLLLSPGETKFVISALSHETGFSLLLVDPTTGIQEYLAEDHKGEFFALSWIDENTLYIWKKEASQDVYLYVKVAQKETSPAPTPTRMP